MTISDHSITVYLPSTGLPETIDKDHPNWEKVKTAIRKQEWDHLEPLMNIPVGVSLYTNGDVEITEDGMFFRKVEINSYIASRIVSMFSEGFSVDPMVNFFVNMMENPDGKVRESVYKWLEAGNMPITEDGYLIGYKYVNDDFTSCHPGVWSMTPPYAFDHCAHYDHTPGNLVEMPREKCDTNPDNTCSSGLHFCAYGYLNQYMTNKRIVVVKINPRDVTSIPSDYNFFKARCCRYEVLDEVHLETTGDFLAGTTVVRAARGVSLDSIFFDPKQEHLEENSDELFDEHDEHDEESDEYDQTDYASDEFDLMFSRGGLVFYGNDLYHLRETLGSINKVAYEIGVASSTVQDWFKKIDDKIKIRQDQPKPVDQPPVESPFRQNAEFVHERTGLSFTRDELKAAISKHGTAYAMQQETGIPRSTINGWLKRV